MNEAVEFFGNSTVCRNRKLLEYFEEGTTNCTKNCDICICTSLLHIVQVFTVIAKIIVNGIIDIKNVTEKIKCCLDHQRLKVNLLFWTR